MESVKVRLIAKLFYGYLTNVVHEESDLAKMTLATCHLVMVSHGITTEAGVSESRVGLKQLASSDAQYRYKKYSTLIIDYISWREILFSVEYLAKCSLH